MVLPILVGVASRWYGFYRYVFSESMDRISSQLVSKLRLQFGDRIHPDALSAYRPRVPLRLYEFEASPACRQVREVLSILDIDYVSLPCPCESFVDETTSKIGRWRLEAEAKGGKALFPFLVDPNTDTCLYTDDIIPYLWEAYGPLCGELDVTVVEAQSLTNRPSRKGGLFGVGANACTRQTFAEVLLLGCPVPPLKTEVRPNTLDPSFHETFSYGITCAQQALQVTIKDKDYGFDENDADACMGRVLIPLGEIVSAIALQKQMLAAKISDAQGDSAPEGEEAREERRALQLNSGERVVLDKWYHLDEERPLRRSALRKLGLLRLRFEFRPREVHQGDMPWQIPYLLSGEQVPQLQLLRAPAEGVRQLAGDLLLAALRFLSLLLALLARPLPAFGRMRTPNRGAEAARAEALAEVAGAEDEEAAAREYLATMTERKGGLGAGGGGVGSVAGGAEQSEAVQGATPRGPNRSVSPLGRKASAAAPRPNLFANVAKGIGRFMQRRRAGSMEPQSPRALDDPFTGTEAAAEEEVARLPHLYAFEAHPAARRVRERLCTLEVPYVVHNVAPGSDKALPPSCVGADGERCLPWFVDPATGFESGEEGEILEYLTRTHATGECAEEWLALTAARYWRRVALEAVQSLLVASLEECSSLRQHLLDRLRLDLLPSIREEVAFSVKETALNLGLANAPSDSAPQRGISQSPIAVSGSRPRSRSRGATPRRGTSPGRSSATSPPGTPLR